MRHQFAALLRQDDGTEAQLERVRGEYREMPGMSLTERQAQRLWGLDPTACRTLFDALLQTGFLRRTSRGYVRAETR